MEELSIRRVDILDGNLVVLELSDGLTIQVTLSQVLALNAELAAASTTSS